MSHLKSLWSQFVIKTRRRERTRERERKNLMLLFHREIMNFDWNSRRSERWRGIVTHDFSIHEKMCFPTVHSEVFLPHIMTFQLWPSRGLLRWKFCFQFRLTTCLFPEKKIASPAFNTTSTTFFFIFHSTHNIFLTLSLSLFLSHTHT